MQGNYFFYWYSKLTNNAYEQNISFRNLLNQMETGEYDTLFCITIVSSCCSSRNVICIHVGNKP